jgi:putative hemolysin
LRGAWETVIGEHLPLVLAVIALVSLSAFFSGSETAFFSLSRSTVEAMERSGRRQRTAAGLLKAPRMLLVTILLGNLLVNIASTSAVTALAIGLFGEKGVGIAVVVMTIVILIFGEIGPKSLALKNSRNFATGAVPLLRFFYIVMDPARILLSRIADFTVERSSAVFGERRERYEAHELATAVELGHHEGLFDDFEREILTNLFLFTETAVHEIIVPRVEVFSLDVRTSLRDAIAQVKERGFSRVPLYGGKDDNIVGVLLAKDLLRYSRDERVRLSEIMRPPLFVPETKHIRDLFGELIASHQHLVIAVDEHGSFSGILSLEDIIEEIFGEIRDRREPKVEDYVMVGEDSIIVEGAMELEDFNDVFGTEIDSPEVETVGGFLIEQIGRIPREGESFSVAGMRFLVIRADQTRVNKIKIERLRDEREYYGDV